MEWRRISGYILVFLPFIFTIALLFVISQNPWFSLTDNALSDMGSIHNPKGYLFNGLLIITGVLTIVASIVPFREGRTLLLPLSGVLLTLVGIFPEETAPHGPAAFFFYVTALADVFIGGLKRRKYVWSAASVITWALMLLSGRFVKGLAVPELIGAFTIFAWLVTLGTETLGQKRF